MPACGKRLTPLPTLAMQYSYIPCLSIAGFDPSGGAGITADIKTFSALGCYAAAAITAITSQSTRGVSAMQPVSAEWISRQVLPVIEDLRPIALKIGMTCNREIIRSIAGILRAHPFPFVVLDPVMISSSGHPLMENDAMKCLADELLPLCHLVTPNLHELHALGGETDPILSARRLIQRYGARQILVKGGHREGLPTDILVSEMEETSFPGQRIATRNDHGTGCTLSAAIAAYVARGEMLPAAIEHAKDFVSKALEAGAGIHIGDGHGPLNHFFGPLPLLVKEKL